MERRKWEFPLSRESSVSKSLPVSFSRRCSQCFFPPFCHWFASHLLKSSASEIPTASFPLGDEQRPCFWGCLHKWQLIIVNIKLFWKAFYPLRAEKKGRFCCLFQRQKNLGPWLANSHPASRNREFLWVLLTTTELSKGSISLLNGLSLQQEASMWLKDWTNSPLFNISALLQLNFEQCGAMHKDADQKLCKLHCNAIHLDMQAAIGSQEDCSGHVYKSQLTQCKHSRWWQGSSSKKMKLSNVKLSLKTALPEFIISGTEFSNF